MGEVVIFPNQALSFEGETIRPRELGQPFWDPDERKSFRRELANELPQYFYLEDFFDENEVREVERDINNDKLMLDCFAWISLALH